MSGRRVGVRLGYSSPIVLESSRWLVRAATPTTVISSRRTSSFRWG
jgi:hypothetical protein